MYYMLKKATIVPVKKELPNFSAANVIGTNIDVFHKNPAHQRGMLANLRGTHKAGEILIARKELQDLGRFVVTLLHEYAHEFGGDGDKSHVDMLQVYMERLINLMEAK